MSRGLKFFISMSGGLTNLFTADTYIGYWIAIIVGFGLCFEVPLFLVILNLARIVTHERFRKWRRLIIFLVFVFAGIASPSPDPLTMLLLGGVVALLVEVAEVLIYFNDRRYARNHPDLYADLGDDQLAPLEATEPVLPREPVDQLSPGGTTPVPPMWPRPGLIAKDAILSGPPAATRAAGDPDPPWGRPTAASPPRPPHPYQVR